MNRRLVLSFISLLVFISLEAQKNNTYTANKDSDPRARQILKAVSEKIKAGKGVTFEFSFVTQSAEVAPVSQKGKARILGNKFVLDFPEQQLTSDGTTLWVYLKKRNEVQVQDAAALAEDPISPYKLLKIHDAPDLVYILAGESKVNGAVCEVIEFKPLDHNAEYFKIKAEIDRAHSQYRSITLYLKSGDSYTLNLSSQANTPLPDSLFVFDVKKYPGIRVEDLR